MFHVMSKLSIRRVYQENVVFTYHAASWDCQPWCLGNYLLSWTIPYLKRSKDKFVTFVWCYIVPLPAGLWEKCNAQLNIPRGLLLVMSYFPISKNRPPRARHLTEASSFSSASELSTISTPLPLVSRMIICSKEQSRELPMWLSLSWKNGKKFNFRSFSWLAQNQFHEDSISFSTYRWEILQQPFFLFRSTNCGVDFHTFKKSHSDGSLTDTTWSWMDEDAFTFLPVPTDV